MKKVLIFGATSFTGRYFIDYALRNKLDSDYSFVYTFRRKQQNQIGGVWEYFDYDGHVSVENFINRIKPDYILNLAGTYSSSSETEIIKINTLFPIEIMKALERLKMLSTRLLLIGSAAEYGNNKELPLVENGSLRPVSEYGLSKKLQTEAFSFYTSNYAIDCNIARTFNVIGKSAPSCLSIGSFYNKIMLSKEIGGEIKVGNLVSRRDFLDLRDVVDAYWKILISGKSGEIYNVCSGKSADMKYVLEHMILESGKKIDVVSSETTFSKNDILDSYGDNSKIINELGWAPSISIEDSISALFGGE